MFNQMCTDNQIKKTINNELQDSRTTSNFSLKKHISFLKTLQYHQNILSFEIFKKIYILMSKYYKKNMEINDLKLFYTLHIDNFWLTVFKNSPVLSTIVEPNDEPILKHLVDIKCVVNNEVTQMGFTVEFIFTPCIYLDNYKLTKKYSLKWKTYYDQRYGGLDLDSIQGCHIEWKKGMDPTVKEVPKLQKHKSKNLKRIQCVKTKSFFEFFETPKTSKYGETNEMILYRDFKLADYICHTIIPNSVLYYTGEFNANILKENHVISRAVKFSHRLRH